MNGVYLNPVRPVHSISLPSGIFPAPVAGPSLPSASGISPAVSRVESSPPLYLKPPKNFSDFNRSGSWLKWGLASGITFIVVGSQFQVWRYLPDWMFPGSLKGWLSENHFRWMPTLLVPVVGWSLGLLAKKIWVPIKGRKETNRLANDILNQLIRCPLNENLPNILVTFFWELDKPHTPLAPQELKKRWTPAVSAEIERRIGLLSDPEKDRAKVNYERLRHPGKDERPVLAGPAQPQSSKPASFGGTAGNLIEWLGSGDINKKRLAYFVFCLGVPTPRKILWYVNALFGEALDQPNNLKTEELRSLGVSIRDALNVGQFDGNADEIERLKRQAEEILGPIFKSESPVLGSIPQAHRIFSQLACRCRRLSPGEENKDITITMPEIRQIRDLLKDDSSPEAMVIKEALRITETYNIVREAAGGPPGAGEPKGQASAPRAKGKKS